MDQAAFSERFVTSADVPFIADSFRRSYRVAGHTAGIRDRFDELICRPLVALLTSASDATDALISARVVFPVSEPTEIAGYVVWSPRHSCLVYVLTKSAYQRRRVASHLLGAVPTVQTDDTRDGRPQLRHCFSTAEFTHMARAQGLRTKSSPFLFMRLLAELTEASDV